MLIFSRRFPNKGLHGKSAKISSGSAGLILYKLLLVHDIPLSIVSAFSMIALIEYGIAGETSILSGLLDCFLRWL
jgi:hypothetical protein